MQGFWRFLSVENLKKLKNSFEKTPVNLGAQGFQRDFNY